MQRAQASVRDLRRELRALRRENEDLRKLAYCDDLTGLPNRRSAERTLDQTLSLAKRHRRDFAVLLLDLDHFKRVNDEHGHDVGDAVLREVGQALARTIRREDVAARWGGEEFVVVLPETSRRDALALAERIRRAVAASSTPVPVTISVGVAGSDQGVSSRLGPEEWIRCADTALYVAKKEGRNRVSQLLLPPP